ncbi:unnamed protein product [Pleuronectes platessa]|uniref:Uncharacterized protein n=1 Tax=Pleuronectes platessa TaxID=8262 RepID=A0A9N7TMH8_PLEPL|nr:unnamed protein product [Pleuronectes platessa]
MFPDSCQRRGQVEDSSARLRQDQLMKNTGSPSHHSPCNQSVGPSLKTQSSSRSSRQGHQSAHPDGPSASGHLRDGLSSLELENSWMQSGFGGVAGWWLQQDKAPLRPILLIIFLHISLGVSSLQCQIIPSTTNPCVPRRSALHPPRCQDLQASQHPATSAFLFLTS